jgi:hypothetical protein
MAARAIVTRYWGEQLLPNGNFAVDVYFLLTDPATFPAQQGCICVTNCELDAANPVTWALSIENSVIAHAASLATPFVLTAGTVFIPTIA